MENRDTYSFKTPGGRTATIKTYLTGRETNQIKQELFGTVTFKQDNGGKLVPDTSKLSYETVVAREKALLAAAIVSLDGSTENVAERAEALPDADYQALVAEVAKLSNGNF